ncbi:helix-turn-helix domain-containing protein [Pseudomonas sp. GD03721]|mgnify:FL=1|jgi:DNA-binding XRE family transcriptional regulator|uniref:Transcriptional regulator n=1 Tax=Ectopseudomonas oleovorans TaxID=301 RepID=A0A2T5PH15_ECTOL|nr:MULTISPECIES: helix-turn-helix transcriptional regulator [Pseudomonas]KFJ91583.1 Cro/Cl family transcriptional regulator [Pseudomonas sp. 1-7]WGL64137.1 helix-turn-helix transcriptional regulator [Pseudomonas sp. CW003PS]MDH1441016.1 helix-turn-helix domain-containing protein [Pseudomonas sp. GD03722]MDM9651772.1 helix-turn-helix transcriptional regulator [Pseudomonas wenzhouensis]MDV5862400.1 helix-turn-helix transcriptional regulator [Pseudomonas mendocina]
MTVQIIARDGEPEYAVLPWADYQALLRAAGREPVVAQASAAEPVAEQQRPGLDQLRRLREAKGLTAESLARSVGISPHYLAMIESGERQPDAAIMRSLAWQLGLEGWS